MSIRSEPAPVLPGRADIRRILIVKWSALGDIVNASLAFEAIYRAFPGCDIDLNTLPVWQPLFAHDPRFHNLLAIDVRAPGGAGMRKWLRAVRAGHYDLIIDLQSNDRSRLLLALLWLSGARPRYVLGHHRRFPYTLAPAPLPPPVHHRDLLRATLAAAGIPAHHARPPLYPDANSSARAAHLLASHELKPGRYAVFLPGCAASAPLKRWGARRYSALALQLRATGVEKIALLGARDDEDECAAIAAACGSIVSNLCGQTEILDILPLCAAARVIVGNDTGAAHLAAATGTPLVVIFGPTDPRRACPVGEQVVSLQAGIYCINCYRKTCTHHSCMALISPEQVLAAISATSGDAAADPG